MRETEEILKKQDEDEKTGKGEEGGLRDGGAPAGSSEFVHGSAAVYR